MGKNVLIVGYDSAGVLKRMPIDKLDGEVRKSDTAPECNLFDHDKGVTRLCCHKCGDDEVQLFRVKENGKKTRPAKYVCRKCR